MDITLSGTVAYKVTMHCAYCSTPFLSRHRLEILGTNIDHMRREIQADFRNRRPDIPVGWVMNGRSNIVCPSCHHKG